VKPYVVIVGGTGAPKWICRLYYLIFCLVCGWAKIIPMPDLGFRPAKENFRQFESILAELCPDVNRKIILVGHSGGAVLIMEYFMKHSGRVLKVMCVNGPLHGTIFHQRFLPKWFRVPGALGDYAITSSYMSGPQGLAARVDRFAVSLGSSAAKRILCIASKNDELVQPVSSAQIVGATNIVIGSAWEHFLSIFDFFIWPQLWSFLAEAIPEAQAEGSDPVVPAMASAA
jgi:pimeloyl-ACP methyl ester carboxylesterase